ncbi:hypothetical protein SDRG_02919 [Saprolegnia diclina VS20]|uniref:Uncharacterized protein n=1 Tax=Saprolegnia diclina (strain VS20) TaxID=1156394 RepID=T0QXV1_SAPDV|nr:hypothetical protein SDRG_02919 [Saprolegnia diclina VS20]EQC39476.1 hypothetical protein SDRG_02919 [Saprolegnia diclina VS20]|eukprot:XP_008606748.1 hypothetical protein SDRG_02919 [Saprolegnia diclina VS20]
MSYVAKHPNPLGSALLGAWLLVILFGQWLSRSKDLPSAGTTLLYERNLRFRSQPESFHVLVTAADDTFALWIESTSTHEQWYISVRDLAVHNTGDVVLPMTAVVAGAQWALTNNGAAASADLRRTTAGALVLELTIPACFGAVARYAFPVARMQLNSERALRARLRAAEAERDHMARQLAAQTKQLECDREAAVRAELAAAVQRIRYEACVRAASEGWTNVYRNCEHLVHDRH